MGSKAKAKKIAIIAAPKVKHPIAFRYRAIMGYAPPIREKKAINGNIIIMANALCADGGSLAIAGSADKKIKRNMIKVTFFFIALYLPEEKPIMFRHEICHLKLRYSCSIRLYWIVRISDYNALRD